MKYVLLIICLAPLFCCAAYMAAQQPPGDQSAAPENAPTAAAPATEAKNPPFCASLVLLKADWSHGPMAKEIDADLRAALSGENKTLLESLPDWVPSIVFPIDAASIYTKEHYAQLLGWLRQRQLFTQSEPFQTDNIFGDSPNVRRLTLSKDADFFGISAGPATNDLFFTRTSSLDWTITETNFMRVNRELRHLEKARGQDTPRPVGNNYDRCDFAVPPLRDGEALIAHAFPAAQDSDLRTPAERKNLCALLVIERSSQPTAPSPQPRVLLPDRVERIDAKRSFGSSSGGLPSALSQRKTENAEVRKTIESGSIIVSWAPAKDVAWGFSKPLGKWAKQEINPPATETLPVLTANVAVWKVGSTLYAFGGKAGRWDVLRLPEDHQPKFTADLNDAVAYDGEDIFTFAGATGRWSSPKGGAAVDEVSDEDVITKIFTLRNMQAADAVRIAQELYHGSVGSIAVDERSNSVIIRATPKVFQELFAIFTRLDEPDLAGGAGAARAVRSGEAENWMPKAQPSAPIAELTKRYEAAEKRVAEVAKQIRETLSTPEARRDRPLVTPDLRPIVGESFAARQELHRAELTQLSQRMQQIEQSIEARSRIANQIIDRRIEELLNPALQWEAAQAKPQTTSERWGNKNDSPRQSGWTESKPATPAATAAAADELSREDDERIWNTLGFRVRALVAEDNFHEFPDGGAVITEIKPLGPADGPTPLRVGDVVTKLGTWEVTNPKRLVYILSERLRSESTVAAGPDGATLFQTQIDVVRRHGTARPGMIQTSITFPAIAWDPESEHVFQALGLSVQKLTAADAPEPKLIGGMKVVAINPEAADFGAKVGDIVTAMQVKGLPAILEVTLIVFRGSERLTLVFPPWGGLPARTNVDPAAVEIRDKLRQRWEQVEKLYEGGRIELDGVLTAANDVRDAELVAAGGSADRIKAREQHADRLAKIKEIVDAKFQAQVEPEFRKLAVDAAALKAAAELKTERDQAAWRGQFAGASALPAASAQPKLDPAAAAAIQAKLRERVEFVKRGFQAGEVPYTEFLKAQIDLANHTLASATTGEERKAAKELKVELLTESLKAIQRLHQSGEAGRDAMLTAEVELLKAKAELEAEGKSPAAERDWDNKGSNSNRRNSEK